MNHDLRTTFTIGYIESKTGGYVGTVREISGIISQGETLEELKSNLVKAMKALFEYHRGKQPDSVGEGNTMLTDELEYC